MVPSGIDKEKLLFQLDKLNEQLGKLNGLKSMERSDIFYSALERILQLSIETCLNIGNHIICGMNFKRADTYREIVVRLTENEIIDQKLGDKLKEFASFRNRLVHIYWDINKEELDVKLKEAPVFSEFARQIYRRFL